MTKENRSTKTKSESILDRSIWSCIFIILGRIFFVREIGSRTISEAFIILICYVVGVAFVGFIYRMDKCLNSASDFLEPLFGLGWFVTISYAQEYEYMFILFMFLITACIVLHSHMAMTVKFRGHDFSEYTFESQVKIFKKRMAKSVERIEKFVGALCIIAMLVIGFVNMIPVTDKVNAYGVNTDNSVPEYAEIGYMFDEDKWRTFDENYKLDILRLVMESEREKLGIEQEINLYIGYIAPPVLAYYDYQEDMIVVDMNHLQTATGTDLLKTLLHEVFHAYEYQLVEVYRSVPEIKRNSYIFRHCDEYIQEYENYVRYDPSEPSSYQEYRDQYLECDSREYADVRFLDYFEAFVR